MRIEDVDFEKKFLKWINSQSPENIIDNLKKYTNKGGNKIMEISDRMKRYEYVTRFFLTCRTPVIIRIDGKAFHTFTRGLEKPFDEDFLESMQQTTLKLCKEIQGCKIGYTQSDEISLLLTDYEKIDSQSWFQNNLSKIISVSSSIATLAFNKSILEKYEQGKDKFKNKIMIANFDSRAFNLPKEEVCNYFIWRQQDATRNSIQSLGQSQFSFKEMQNKNCNEIQEMLWKNRNINWNDIETTKKRGSCVIKKEGKWMIDNEIPIFTQNREYIENLL